MQDWLWMMSRSAYQEGRQIRFLVFGQGQVLAAGVIWNVLEKSAERRALLNVLNTIWPYDTFQTSLITSR